MKNFINYYLKMFFSKDIDLRVRLFHVLAITGFLICVAMTIVSVVGNMIISAIINVGAGLVSLFLLFYSARKGHYKLCYIVSVVVIFLILFPTLFFSGGGYQGGMPFFFVFAVVFTVYMLDGWLMLITALGEILFYSCLCVLAYLHPQLVIPFPSQQAVLIDVIIGLCTVSISLGATMYVQIRMYQRQQAALERAQLAAESASNAKSVFLANMSHEIRTPIHMILGMNEIIYRESRGRQVQEYSAKIDEASKMLLSLVDSILDVSKIESGKTDILLAPYDTGSLVRTLVLIGKSQCSSKGLRFSCHVSEDFPPRLMGDYAHIQQIVTNFLSNAAKYTSHGNVTLSFSQEPGAQEHQINLCISVQDTGIGIRKEAIPGLFDAFTRADASAHRHIAGTGLGLAIVKKLTALMDGTVHVESELGVGSTFSVVIPQQLALTEEHTHQERAVTFVAPGARLLVVDDNLGNCLLMRQLLEPTHIIIDTAGSGPEAIRLASQNHYHLILLDYMMPDMDGLATMLALQKLPDFCTPVIALTADATSETAEKLLSAGCVACVTKPVPWKTLRDTLLRHLPEELITITGEEQADPKCRSLQHSLEPRLLPYGISLEEGLHYFQNSLEEYSKVARIFINHDSQEQAEVRKLFADENYEKLRYHIHSLKGKARNMGMGRLAEVSAYAESLCNSDNREEIRSLMPYLLYLWSRGMEGLKLLLPAEPISPSDTQLSVTQCTADLPDLLRQLKRKPSLACLKILMQQEAGEEGQAMLSQITDMVNAISFEKAEQAFRKYLKWKEENHDS